MKMKTKPDEIFAEYEKGVAFKSGIGLMDTVKENENFYIGKQWEGVQAPDLDKPVMNILRRVVTFFISSIVSDDIAVSIDEFQEEAQNKGVVNMISGQFAEIMEFASVKRKFREAVRNAAVDGDGCIHYYFDNAAHFSERQQAHKDQALETPGHIEAEILDNTNVIFGNPFVTDVQKQPYIQIVYRRLLDEAREIAKENGQNAEEIRPDYGCGEAEQGGGLERVSVVRKYWKEKGEVFFCEVTQNAVLKEKTSTGLSLYPIAWLTWEKVKNQYHGQAAITGMIPNQIFINKLFAMAMQHVKMLAFPKVVYNAQMLPEGWDNRIGAAIPVNGDPNMALASSFKAADMSNQVLLMIEKVISHTRDTMGASDAVLGNVKPDNTSAIIATQKATSMPLELQKMEYYHFVEDSVRIWLEMMGEYYGVRSVKILQGADFSMPVQGQGGEDMMQGRLFDFASIKNLRLSLNVDIGAATYWSEIMQVQTLDNLFAQGIFKDPELYLELMPAAYVKNKQKIIEHIKAEKAKEEQAVQQMQEEQSAQSMGMPQPMGMPQTMEGVF